MSPLALLLRGLIRVALCVFFMVVVLRVAGSEEIATVAGSGGGLRMLAVVIMIGLVVGGAFGAFSAVVGVLDLVPRHTVTGTVVSLSDRRAFDFLPYHAQRLLFERNRNEIDERRVRTEVVLSTDKGHQQWTVRRHAVLRHLLPGARVTLTVTPIAGYVAQAEQSPQTPANVL